MLGMPLLAYAQVPDTLEAVAEKAGCEYVDLLQSELFVPGESVSDWFAIATGCSGNPVKRDTYLKGLEQYVTDRYAESGGLHSIKATEYHRISLAVLALGGDPTRFGTDKTGTPINLIADGTYNWAMSDSLGMQGLNGWIFALITLDSMDYQIPDTALYTREEVISELLAAQTEDGGFGLSGGSPDVDITAMTLQALAPYCETNENVRLAADKALNWLSARQTENGDFSSWGSTNAESTAQTVIALCSLGIDPQTDERFCKNGISVMDGLLRYQTDCGMFRHTIDGEEDMMATEQAVLALIAFQRLKQDGNRLYDFSEIEVYSDTDHPMEDRQTGDRKVWVLVGVGAVIAAAAVAVWIWSGKKRNV